MIIRSYTNKVYHHHILLILKLYLIQLKVFIMENRIFIFGLIYFINGLRKIPIILFKYRKVLITIYVNLFKNIQNHVTLNGFIFSE